MGKLSGPGAFITNGSATGGKLKGKVSWVAQKAGEGGVNLPNTQHPENGLDASEVKKTKDATGVPVWLWTKHESGQEMIMYQKTLELAQESGADGVIFTVSNKAELDAAIAAGKNSSIPKAIALTGPMLSQAGSAGVPADWQKMIFVDNMTSSAADDMSPEQLAQVLKDNPDIVTILPTHSETDPPKGGPAGEDYPVTGPLLDNSKYAPVLAGNSNVGISHAEEASPAQIDSLSKRGGGTSSPTGAVAPSTGGGGTSSHQGSTNSTPQPKKPEVPMGIDNPASHFAAGTKGAPPIFDDKHTTAAPILDSSKTFSFIAQEGKNKGKKVTITTTSTGARIEQVDGGNPYQISAPDRTYPVKPEDARHWSDSVDTSNSVVKGANASGHGHVLATTPGSAPDVTLVQMSDGSYLQVKTSTGQVIRTAGTWGDSQGGGQSIAGIGAGVAPKPPGSIEVVPPGGTPTTNPTSSAPETPPPATPAAPTSPPGETNVPPSTAAPAPPASPPAETNPPTTSSPSIPPDLKSGQPAKDVPGETPVPNSAGGPAQGTPYVPPNDEVLQNAHDNNEQARIRLAREALGETSVPTLPPPQNAISNPPPQQPTSVVQSVNQPPPETPRLNLGAVGPIPPPAQESTPPETNPVANFNPSSVGGVSEN